MLRTLAEPDECDVGLLACGDRTDVLDVDLTSDHFVSQRDHDRSDQSGAILALVSDQDAQMLGLAIVHQPL